MNLLLVRKDHDNTDILFDTILHAMGSVDDAIHTMNIVCGTMVDSSQCYNIHIDILLYNIYDNVDFFLNNILSIDGNKYKILLFLLTWLL